MKTRDRRRRLFRDPAHMLRMRAKWLRRHRLRGFGSPEIDIRIDEVTYCAWLVNEFLHGRPQPKHKVKPCT